MSKPIIYTSEQGLLRAVSNEETGYGTFNLFHNYTHHQLGVIDAEMGQFKPTHTDYHYSIGQLSDLIHLLKFLQEKYETV